MRLVCPLCQKHIAKNDAKRLGYRYYHKKCADAHAVIQKSFQELHQYFKSLTE